MENRTKVVALWIHNFPPKITLDDSNIDDIWQNPEDHGLNLPEEALEQAFFEISEMEHMGIRLVTCIDPEYPKVLKKMPNRPWVIKYLGFIPDNETMAVVGSRKASNLQLLKVEEVVQRFPANYNIISGGAYGVDTAAHQAALNTNHKTTVVNPGNFRSLYPKPNIPLFRSVIRRKGCVLSLLPEIKDLNRSVFLYRNRVIVHLSQIVTVIAADYPSGSWSTGNYAINNSKQVFCIPGTLGCDKLINKGAQEIS